MNPLNTIVFRSIAAITLGFFCVYVNGLAVVWLVYEFEREDIIANYFQYTDPEGRDKVHPAANSIDAGRIYIAAVFERSTGHASDTYLHTSSAQESSAPKPPATVQELLAIVHELTHTTRLNASSVFRFTLYLAWFPCGCSHGIFHPPR
jgi:hypothetical protein